jgi:hypothetical protein
MAIDKFNQIRCKRVLYCILDSLGTCDSVFSKELSTNVSDFFVHSCIASGYDIFISDSENELLKAAAESNFYTHAVIVSTGTYFGLSRRLFQHVENLCMKDFFIAGHILDRDESYIELHQQFYIINLSDYIELDFPNIASGSHVDYQEHTQIEPIITSNSEKKYVIVNIKKGSNLRTYNRKLHGWDILTTAIDKNKTIIDLGEDIRNHKRYLYYEYDHVFVNNIQELYYNQFFCHNFFAAWNTDAIYESIPFDGPVEQYVTVGTGLNWIRNLEKLRYTDSTKIIFTDINQSCLMFMKLLVSSWDGENYADFYKNNMPMIPNAGPDVMKQLDLVKNEFESFKNSFSDWDEVWKKIQNLKYDFILIDYTSKYNLDWLAYGKKTFVNLSDLFNFGPFCPFQGIKYRVAAENRLLQKLKDLDTEIVLTVTSRAAKDFLPNWGQQTSKVKDFELTDLNKLKKPPWHYNDWNHNGFRPFGL